MRKYIYIYILPYIYVTRRHKSSRFQRDPNPGPSPVFYRQAQASLQPQTHRPLQKNEGGCGPVFKGH